MHTNTSKNSRELQARRITRRGAAVAIASLAFASAGLTAAGLADGSALAANHHATRAQQPIAHAASIPSKRADLLETRTLRTMTRDGVAYWSTEIGANGQAEVVSNVPRAYEPVLRLSAHPATVRV